MLGGHAHHLPAAPGTHEERKNSQMHFNPSQNASKYAYIVHKTLLRSRQKHTKRFLSMTIFIPAENTRHSKNPGQNPV
jgi:hypothetical protein